MKHKVVVLRADGSNQRPQTNKSNPYNEESLPDLISRISEDIKDLTTFYNVISSPTRSNRLHDFFTSSLESLHSIPFPRDQQSKIDYLLLQSHLRKNIRQLQLDAVKNGKAEPLLPFKETVMRLVEARQQMTPMDAETAARDLFDSQKKILELKSKLKAKTLDIKISKSTAFRAANTAEQLRSHLKEWYNFYTGYDPLFTWWCKAPYSQIDAEMGDFAEVIKEELVGIKKGDKDAIVGEPIGREGILADLESEMIPYPPGDVIKIGEEEYKWCLREMKKASKELGFENWREALEYVKTLYVPPGKQTELVKNMMDEAVNYVEKHDLITVPQVAKESARMFMMTPHDQKTNPFFLGGEDIIVSYPDDSMGHEEKMMSMRGNNIHFSRSTVFHEMIPGHHLQMYMAARYHPYRRMFDTPFWMEGWALYWEMILWDKGFPETPENRIGMLFWRMHRCARIIFSLKFHLGEMTPQECIDMLVDMVGHERATAEGEVRRSFNGDYTPLYQAGYMLGALQLYSLRGELVQSGKMGEKEFHDRVMREGYMPIEMLRALIENLNVKEDFKTSWRFYVDL